MTLTTAGLRAFRAAATLADVVPTARIRIRDESRLLFTVSRTAKAAEDEGTSLPPCAFRAAVGRAHRLHRQGVGLRFVDVPPGREPAIDVGLRTGDSVLPGHIYRIGAANQQYLLLFMTELTVEACERTVADALATSKRCDVGSMSGGGQAPMRRVGFHGDVVTQLTVVHTMSAADRAERAGRLMTRLLEVCVAQEMITELEAIPGPPRPEMRS